MEWKLSYNKKREEAATDTVCVESILNYVDFMQTICINSCNQKKCTALNVFASHNGQNESQRKISWPFPMKRYEN